MMTMLGALAAGQGASDRPLMSTGETAIKIAAGANETTTIVSAIESRGTRLHETSNYHADPSESAFVIGIVNTRCEAPSHARWRPLAPFEWSPVVIFATMMTHPPTYAPATCDTFARRG